MSSGKIKVPGTLYHGTNASFDQFDLSFLGSNTRENNTIHGFFFTKKVKHARLFGNRIISASLQIQEPLDLTIPGIFNRPEQAPVIWEILNSEQLPPDQALELLNEEIGLAEIADVFDTLYSKEASVMIKANGFDSIIADMGAGNLEYVVFDPGQISIIRHHW